MVSPLKRPLCIELHNGTFFPTNSDHIITSSLDQASCDIDTLAFQEHNLQLDMSTAQALFDDSKTMSPSVEIVTSTTLDVNHDTLDMSDKLFYP